MASTTTGLTETEDDKKADSFKEMDALDENQIIAESKGKVIEEYFYEIKDKDSGKVQAGLSFAGTKWAKRKMGEANPPHPISVVHADVIDLPDSIRVMTYVEDLADHTKLIGAYEQPRMMKVAQRDESGKKIPGKTELVPNPNAFTLAVSKAERNGIRHHLPEKYILSLYDEWKKLKALPAPAGKKERKVNNDIDADSLGYKLQEFEGIGIQEGAGELQVNVSAKALLDTEYMDKLKLALEPFDAVYVPRSADRGAYYAIKVGPA